MQQIPSRADSYYQDILYAVFLVMLRAGISTQDTSALANAVLTAAHNQLRAKKPENPRLSVIVAGVLHTWHHKRRYVDACGKPRALALTVGRRSVASLVRSEDKRIEVSAAISAMKRLKLIRRAANGHYFPTTRFATIRELDPVLAEHVCHSLGRLLATVSNNTQEGMIATRLIERSAQVQDLPRRKLAEFRDFANSQGELFVSSVNDWLESRRASNGRRKHAKISRAGVHVFAFSEPVKSSRGVRMTAP